MKLNTNIKICRKWTGKRINKHKNTRKEKIKKKKIVNTIEKQNV